MKKLDLNKISITKLNNLQSIKIIGGTGPGDPGDPDDPGKSKNGEPICDPPDRTGGDGVTNGEI